MTDSPQQDDDPFPEDNGGQLALPSGDSGTLEVFPPARGHISEARRMLSDHVAMLDDAYRFADIVCQTPAAPQRYRGKAKEGTVAIMYGAEIGLPPMASLQKVINIHGSPSLEARTMKGLLKTKGFQFRTILKAEDEFIIHAWEPTSDRRTDPPDEVAHWTIDRALRAKFCPREDPNTKSGFVERSKQDGTTVVDGNMKYIEQPIEMLEAKGTAEVCRAIAPEILMGLPYAAEERDDWGFDEYEQEEEPKPRRRRAKGVGALRDRAKAAGAKAEERAEAAADEPQDAEVVSDKAAASGDAEVAENIPDSIPADEVLAEVEAHDRAVAEAAMQGFLDTGQYHVTAPDDTGSGAPSAEAPEAPAATPPAAPPDPAPQDSGAAVPPEPVASGAAQPGEPASAAAAPDPEPAPPPPAPEQPTQPAAGGMEMSEEVRARGERMLANLLEEARLEDEGDRLPVVAEIAAKRPGAKYRPLSALYELTNAELKYVVDQLRGRKADGKLYDYCGEALNAAVLREVGMTGDQ